MKRTRSKTVLWDRTLLDLIVIMSFASLAIYLVRKTGFSAISDDDYSRVVIAQTFAAEPSWDPSGTSWLPLPFFLTGAAMLVWEPSLSTGLATQLVLSVCSAGLLYGAGRSLGAGRGGALVGSALCFMIPTAAFLAASPAPGFVTAALLALAMVRSGTRNSPWIGGACFLLACASRYEAWAPSLLWGLFQMRDASSFHRRDQRAGPALAGAALAWAFPFCWLAHGSLTHNDALFFVKRVANYKAALGHTTPSFMELLEGYPKTLFVAEPAITYCALFVGLAVALVSIMDDPDWGLRDVARFSLSRRARPFWLALALLAALTLGAARGGAPTHHPERALLSIWLCCALMVGKALERVLACRRYAFVPLLSAGLAGLFSFALLQGRVWERQGFAERKAEERIGAHIRAHAPHRHIAVSLPDYGYFAVIAAAGNPGRFTILQSNDPRTKLSGRDPLADWLQDPEHCAYVTLRDHPGLVPRVLAIEGELLFAQQLECPPQEHMVANLTLQGRRSSPELASHSSR